MKDERKEDITIQECPDCQAECPRVPAFNIAKHEIAEKTHGGVVKDGKLVRRFTGFDEIREERQIEKTMRHAQKNNDRETAIDAAKALGRKRKENKIT